MALTDIIPWGRNRTIAPSYADDRDPFTSLQRDMNRLFDEFTRGFGFPTMTRSAWTTAWPRVDVSETPTEVKVTAELPGLEEKDVDLSLHDGMLTIRGEKTTKTEGTLYSERWQGQFERSIEVGPNVDPDKVSASFKSGILSIVLTKRPESQEQVKRIPIAAG